MKFDIKTLEKFSPLLRKKIIEVNEENIHFLEALKSNNLLELKELLEKNYPKAFNVFTEEEQYEIGDNIGDEWDYSFYNINKFLINERFIKDKSQELIDLLAEYKIYDKGVWASLRKAYFACTANKEAAITYTNILYENTNFLHEEKIDWICGAIYNCDDSFFDNFFEIHIKNNPIKNIFKPIISSYILNGEESCKYNFNSWCKYYNYYFELAVKEIFNYANKLGVKQYKKENAITEIFTELYNVFKNIEDNNNKFICFLNSEYNRFFNIPNPDFIKVNIAVNYRETIEKYKTTNFLTRKSYFRSSNIGKDLSKAIQKAIENNSIEECEKFFSKIGLDKNYYSSLVQCLNLKEVLKEKEEKEYKIKKI